MHSQNELPDFAIPSNPASPRDIASNPDFYLYKIDTEKAEVQFLEVTPDSYLFSAFLDNRIVLTRERLHGFSIENVISALQEIGIPSAPVQFLFHTSFCCSSLLARSLQAPGISMVLREPLVLRQIGDMKRRLTMDNAWTDQGAALTDIALTLLGKTYSTSEQVLIKPTNLANNLISDIRLLRPSAKMLLLYSDIEAFLISNLKKTQDTKNKFVTLARMFARDVNYSQLVNGVDIEQLSFLQAVFVVWHAQMMHFSNVLNSSEKSAVMSLDAESLLQNPEETLSAASRFYQLPLSDEQISSIVNGPIWNTHAKDPMSPYGRQERTDENAAIYRQNEQAILETMRWSETLLTQAPIDVPLPNNLAS